MSQQKPNILLVVVDCARSDKWVGPGRSTVTPNLDRLCEQGVTFPTTITEKSCTTPSFSTLLTGRYSPRHGVHLVWGYRLPQQVPMLTEVLSRNGYHTYAEVSGPLLAEMGLDRGFDSYEYRAPCDYLHTAWGEQFIEKLRNGAYRAPWFVMLHVWELHPDRRIDPECGSPGYGRDEYEQAISSLDRQLGPLFDAVGDDTLIAFTGDHGEKSREETYRPGTAVDYACKLLGTDDADGLAPFGVAQWAGPSVLQELYGQCAPAMRDLRLRDVKRQPPPGFWTRLRDRLRLLRLTPMVFFHDLLALGAPLKLTEMLKRRGLLDAERARSKVARLTRAVGKERLLDMHMRMWTTSYKRNLQEGHIIHVYDFLVRVPLVLRWPDRLPAGAVHRRMVRQPDIFPTLLDLIGIDAVEWADADGRSFKPLIDGRPWEPEPAFLSVTGTPADLELYGVRTEDYKYTYGPRNEELPKELYDLRADPGETHNLAADRPELCAELQAVAQRFARPDSATPSEQMQLSADDEQRVTRHLQSLGYLD